MRTCLVLAGIACAQGVFTGVWETDNVSAASVFLVLALIAFITKER